MAYGSIIKCTVQCRCSANRGVYYNLQVHMYVFNWLQGPSEHEIHVQCAFLLATLNFISMLIEERAWVALHL